MERCCAKSLEIQQKGSSLSMNLISRRRTSISRTQYATHRADPFRFVKRSRRGQGLSVGPDTGLEQQFDVLDWLTAYSPCWPFRFRAGIYATNLGVGRAIQPALLGGLFVCTTGMIAPPFACFCFSDLLRLLMIFCTTGNFFGNVTLPVSRSKPRTDCPGFGGSPMLTILIVFFW